MTEAPTSPLGRSRDAFARQEFPFTPGDFRRIAAMFRQDAGIALGEIKAPLVYARLVKRLRALGLENFAAYCEHVESRGGTAEREQMIAALTTNVTRFMREPHHFDHLKTKVLADLIDGVRRGASLRIWSAGCSTGEEPYSIALAVLSMLPDAKRYDVKILATDINKHVLGGRAQGRLFECGGRAAVARQQRAMVRSGDRAQRRDDLARRRGAWKVGVVPRTQSHECVADAPPLSGDLLSQRRDLFR